jgi:hypothetical protein
MRTAPVPIGAPAAAGSGVGGSSGGVIGTSALSRGSGGMSAGGDVVASIPRVTRALCEPRVVQIELGNVGICVVKFGGAGIPVGMKLTG